MFGTNGGCDRPNLGMPLQQVAQMTTIKLLIISTFILMSSAQAFAGSGQNGPIGPGSRYGLQPGPDAGAAGSNNSQASMQKIRHGNGYVMGHPRYRRRHQ